MFESASSFCMKQLSKRTGEIVFSKWTKHNIFYYVCYRNHEWNVVKRNLHYHLSLYQNGIEMCSYIFFLWDNPIFQTVSYSLDGHSRATLLGSGIMDTSKTSQVKWIQSAICISSSMSCWCGRFVKMYNETNTNISANFFWWRGQHQKVFS